MYGLVFAFLVVCVLFRSYHGDLLFLFFFFQAEDGIRDLTVTGVQTCALPISRPWRAPPGPTCNWRARCASGAWATTGWARAKRRWRLARGLWQSPRAWATSARWPSTTTCSASPT